MWVKKWVDYSTKYGLGYMLSNKCTGVFFNDATKIVIDPEGNKFNYFERKLVSQSERLDVMNTYTLTEYPKELQKKVTLLQHFRSYLETSSQGSSSSTNPVSGSLQPTSDIEMKDESGNPTPVYVKKWMRTKHAIMFRLNNKVVQVNF